MQSADKKYFLFTKGINTEAPLVAWPEGYTIDEQNFDLLIDGSRRRRPGLSPETAVEVPDDAETLMVLTGSMLSGDVELNWTEYSFTNGELLDYYKLWRSDNGAAEVLLATVDAGTETYTDTTLVPDHTYTYYVVAWGAEGAESSPSNEVDFTYDNTYVPDSWINGGAEYTDLSGWTSTLGNFSAQTGTNFAWPDPSGTWGFYAGNNASSKMNQDFSVDSTGMSTTTVDAGNAELVIDWYAGTYHQYGSTNDQPRLNVTFKNAGGTTIGTATTGYLTLDITLAPEGQQIWVARQEVYPVPALTRTIVIECEAKRRWGTSNDAKFDGIEPYLREAT